MGLLRVLSLVVYGFGVFAYGATLALWTRQRLAAREGAPERRPSPTDGAMSVMGLVWFLACFFLTVGSFDPSIKGWVPLTVLLMLAFLYPPLIMHVVYLSNRAAGRIASHPGWWLPVVAVYVVSQALSLVCVLGYWRLGEIPRQVLNLMGNVGPATLFLIAAAYTVYALSRPCAVPQSAVERKLRRSWLVLFVVLSACAILMLLAAFDIMPIGEVLGLGLRSLPLLFLVVGTYFEDRFQFFDVFVKQGLSLLATALAVAALLAVLYPALDGIEFGWARPIVYALVLLPAAAATPWLHRSIGRWIDRAWLGREHLPLEAINLFLAGTRHATSERALVAEAEKVLASVFRAAVRVETEQNGDAVAPAGAMAAPLRIATGDLGREVASPRADGVAFFSEDAALLAALADVLASVLDNVRLQEKKRQLALHASRSELKALQAQIRPHFLFNALNAIAGLIRKDPALADHTVERLAEVFRYTLRRSEHEWTRLGDELELARAYLDVEKARFGERFEFSIRVGEELGSVPVPSMMVQTLVENAVKHGIAELRGGGRIEIEARRVGERLHVEVVDNGPGPRTEQRPRQAGGPGEGSDGGNGYGLRNVRERLAGYYGSAAGLELVRDAERGLTLAILELPLATALAVEERDAPSARQQRETN